MNYHVIHLILFLTLVLIIGSLPCNAVEADESDSLNQGVTEWTLGLGAGVFDYNLYPGSKATNRFVIPAPYFTFRSPKLEIDRGIKGFLYQYESVVLDISADFALPADSDDTLVRKGMPDLDFMVQLGPSLEFLLNDSSKSYFDIRFELPVRAAFVTDVSYLHNIGYILEPRFSFNHRRLSRTGLSHKATIGLKFATRKFHAYYYDVAPEFSNATRPAYNSDAGFSGSFIKYRISYRSTNFVYWIFLRYQSLHGAVFEDSPLVLHDDDHFVGLGFAWIIAGSL
jgi:outer membrane scaffolding protein for murein synthesis (MipA/OmpV family)